VEGQGGFLCKGDEITIPWLKSGENLHHVIMSHHGNITNSQLVKSTAHTCLTKSFLAIEILYPSPVLEAL